MTKSIRQSDESTHSVQPSHVVVIGASAGGLDAVQQLVRHLSLPGHFAYILAQHLSPDHPSQLVDIISRFTSLRVITAVDGAALEPGVIVIAPPNHDLVLEGGCLRVRDPLPRFGPSPCIDLLLESLAEQWGEKGIAVVLSGTGSDGARGMRAISAAGGLTMVQSPEEAKFDGMPKAAIALGGADLVLEAGAIGEHLSELIREGETGAVEALPESELMLLHALKARLKQLSGIDFSKYKESTLRRQLNRRMAMQGITSLNDYLPLLSSQGPETRELVHNLLVSVTSFFRDPKAFEALREQLRSQWEALLPPERLRVWVAGCASGEEAYSIAMLLSELLGHPEELATHLRIFATDLDEPSLATARRGLYPLSAAATIPEHLRLRFLREQGGMLEVTKELRNCIVFARHNLCEDPPFPNLDLISCRYTLIYFTAPVQAQVLHHFAYALRPGGLLFLGGSEAIGNRSPGFAVVNASHRLFQRTLEVSRRQIAPTLAPSQPFSLSGGQSGRMASQRSTVPEQHVVLLEALVHQLYAPALVLDQAHELVEVIGDVSPYCRLPPGRMSAKGPAFLRPELQAEARVLLLLVRAEGGRARSGPLHLADIERPIRLLASPLKVGDCTLTLLSFHQEPQASDTGSSVSEGGDRAGRFGREIERLEQELLSNQDNLRHSLSELEQANEELEASSEELQASSEELQASNEELEASNEELQATNEELATLNQQLRSRSEQLERLNNDLENIQASLSQGMVILDRHLRITRFSPLAVRVFGLVASDIGQPLVGVPTTVPLPDLRETLMAVMESGHRSSVEASSEEVSYLVQFMPYQQQDGLRLGVILSLTDVSELVALRRAAEAALSEFTCLTIALEVAVWKKDSSLQKLLFMSERIRSISGWTPAELCQQPQLLEKAIDPADSALVRKARNLEQGAWSVAYRLQSRDGRKHWVQEAAKVMQEGSDPVVVGTLTDITELRALEAQARQQLATLAAMLENTLVSMAGLDAELQLVLANDSFCTLVGWSRETIQGMPAAAFAASGPGPFPDGSSQPADDLMVALQAVLAGRDQPRRRRLSVRRQDGTILGVEAEILPVGQPASQLPDQPEGQMRLLLIIQDCGAGST